MNTIANQVMNTHADQTDKILSNQEKQAYNSNNLESNGIITGSWRERSRGVRTL